MTQTLTDGADLQTSAHSLLNDPIEKANRVIILLKAVHANRSKETGVAGIRGLKVFFSDKQEKGHFAADSAEGEGSAAHKFRVWLTKHQSSFHARLRHLFEDGAPPEMQVAAVAALMEGVRGWEDSGNFDVQLFDETCKSMCYRNTSPEALSFFISKYLDCPDVRYYVLKAVTKYAQQKAAKGTITGEEQRDTISSEGSDVSISTMYDMLMYIGPENGAASQSWCGADATQAQKGALSSKERRKRKRMEEGSEAADKPAGKPAKWANPILQKRAWSNAWLSFLAVALPEAILRKVLVRMHTKIVPHMASPLLLTDFLFKALDVGGLMGMLALHGIFILVTKHGLEYPHFYERLYRLLTPAYLMAKHRERFFQLADVFLSSTLVPAYTVAAFAKRFARLALTASPAGAMLAIAFVHNLLRRHPACTVLLHRQPSEAQPGAGASAATSELSSIANGQDTSGSAVSQNGQGDQPDEQETEKAAKRRKNAVQHGANRASAQQCNGNPAGNSTPVSANAAQHHSSATAAHELSMEHAPEQQQQQKFPGMDMYNAAEDNPGKSRAIESSLWEIESLRNHYSPQVAAFVTILDKDLADRKKTAEVDIAPLLTSSYSEMSIGELAKRLKQVPVAFYAQKPQQLFDADLCKADFAGWAL